MRISKEPEARKQEILETVTQIQIKLQVIIPVRQSEVRIHRTEHTIIGITDAASPYTFSLEQVEEIILMDRIVGYQ